MAFLYPVTPPFKLFFDSDGSPLDEGFVYFGSPNQNPETVPIQMYWDAGGTIPAVQPIRTTANGYITRTGTPANIFAVGNFSITVRDRNGVLVFTNPVSTDIQLASAILSGTTSAAAIGIADAGHYYAPAINVEDALQELGPLFAQMTTALAAICPTGTVADWVGTDTGPHAVPAPTGWLYLSQKTIGNAVSGATARANADTQALFVLLWNSYANAELPIQDSFGTATGRDASSAINDFNAGKRLPLPDPRGRVRATRDDQGGTAAGRLTSAGLGGGAAGTTMGASGVAAQTVTLAVNQMPVHSHVLTDLQHTHTFNGAAHSHTIGNFVNGYTSGTTATGLAPSPASSSTAPFAASGSNVAASSNISMATAGGTAGITQPHSVVQPTLVFSTIIKL